MATTILTPREVEVVNKAIAGLGDKQIALELNVKLATIRTHWERIRSKMAANNRTHAVAMFMEADFIKKLASQIRVLGEGNKLL